MTEGVVGLHRVTLTEAELAEIVRVLRWRKGSLNMISPKYKSPKLWAEGDRLAVLINKLEENTL